METSRFAPSITGHAHAGTLLAALLAWLDARRAGARFLLRLENLDRGRDRPGLADEMIEALRWLGLDWDEMVVQSDRADDHAAALDRLAARGLLYPCSCSRSAIRGAAVRAADGGHVYPGTCRERPLPAAGWSGSTDSIRLRMPGGRIDVRDAGGVDLAQDPSLEMGDPVVVRRDGAVAYHLAVVVDDAASGVTRIVRGRDLAAATATQVALQRLLGYPTPTYRHHLLLLEASGDKKAKLHGSFGYPEIRERVSGPELCGRLAAACGLMDAPAPIAPVELLSRFDWAAVHGRDQLFEL